jgi:hypothetical protein
MHTLNPQYVTDKSGKRISVIIPIHDFNSIVKKLEELEDIRLYDKVKSNFEPAIPIEEAFKIIEASRSKLFTGTIL